MVELLIIIGLFTGFERQAEVKMSKEQIIKNLTSRFEIENLTPAVRPNPVIPIISSVPSSQGEENNVYNVLSIMGELTLSGIGTWANDLWLIDVWYDVTYEKVGKESRTPFALWYLGGNTLIGASLTWATGSILKQQGSFTKSLIGGAIGSIVGILAITPAVKEQRGPDILEFITVFLAPSLGAVIGYNWK